MKRGKKREEGEVEVNVGDESESDGERMVADLRRDDVDKKTRWQLGMTDFIRAVTRCLLYQTAVTSSDYALWLDS